MQKLTTFLKKKSIKSLKNKLTTKFEAKVKICDIVTAEKDNFWLWVPVLFGFGASFYLAFEQNFLTNFSVFVALFFLSVIFCFFNRNSLRCLIFLSLGLFLLGAFYANFYQKNFTDNEKITGKIFVDVVGKVESVRHFYNPANRVEGAILVISKPNLYKAKFDEKKKIKKKKKVKKPKKKKPKKEKVKKEKSDLAAQKTEEIAAVQIQPNLENSELATVAAENLTAQNSSINSEEKPKKPRKKRARKKPKAEICVENSTSCEVQNAENIVVNQSLNQVEKAETKDEETKEKPKKPKKKKPKKPKKKKPISAKTIEKDFVNLSEYQEIDRKFLDFSKNYQQVEWLQIKGREQFPSSLEKISLNLIKNFQNVAVNDLVAVRAMLQPPNKHQDFGDDFNFAFDAKFKKIGAFGFALGEAKILQKAQISSLEDWFLQVRQKFRAQILSSLKGDSAAIALAFLIGDQTQISPQLLAQIRISGLAHLLSISGFHLSLAAAIFFGTTRFCLSRSQFLTLNFDLKKISAIAAIFGAYFYLKIAGSPIPAKRAFLFVLFGLLALFFAEKVNAKRAIMLGALLLILQNPYAVFNLSFQLSFVAILVLCCFFEGRNQLKNQHFLRRIFWYFGEIVLLSILVQIATTPILMHSFQSVALLGFVANVLAIPLTSFLVMPLGFLALFLMALSQILTFGLEKYALIAMEKGIFCLEKIAEFVANLDFSQFLSPQISNFGVFLAIVGLLIFCLGKSPLRFIGIAVFALSFATIFNNQKPEILFDAKQRFFAIYGQEDGLVFSKDLKNSRIRDLWMKKMNENNFKSLVSHPKKEVFCNEKRCVIDKKQKILVLLKRNKISEICQNNFDVIVNLTKKYQLPACISSDKIKVDNVDFWQKGAQFFYKKDEKLFLKN
jgi:competence protein ComEC